MLFSSISFLYYFLAFTLLIYFAAPKKLKNTVLLLASIVFYFYGEQLYTLLMLANVLLAYVHGLLIDRFRGKRLSKIFMVSSVVISLATLGLFKYSDFFIQTVNSLFKTDFAYLGLTLPIGISFYTFQTLSYTIDVYRGDARVQKNPISLATYVMLFPQLIAGPIVRYTTVENELRKRTHSFEQFSQGAFRFTVGLSKKVLIANQLGELCDIFRASNDKSVIFFWIYAVAFSMHIYFDFSGYSDMAIGLGRIFGFNFLENFNYPFISESATEFWRRWHMSLGTWFRDYLYIPLGGNRVSTPRWVFNIFVVWFLTGLWHGASWNFVLWGLYFGILLVIEKLFLSKLLLRLPKVLRHIYLIVTVAVSFVIFNANGMSQAISDIVSMLGLGKLPLWSGETAYYLSSYALLLAFGIIGSTPLVRKAGERLSSFKAATLLQPLSMALMLFIVTAYLVDGSFNPFLYFRF